jgi:hypothetical protein
MHGAAMNEGWLWQFGTPAVAYANSGSQIT